MKKKKKGIFNYTTNILKLVKYIEKRKIIF